MWYEIKLDVYRLYDNRLMNCRLGHTSICGVNSVHENSTPQKLKEMRDRAGTLVIVAFVWGKYLQKKRRKWLGKRGATWHVSFVGGQYLLTYTSV